MNTSNSQAPWICDCGFENEPHFERCMMCGKRKSTNNEGERETRTRTSGLSWDEAYRSMGSRMPELKWQATYRPQAAPILSRSDIEEKSLSRAEISRLIDQIRSGGNYEAQLAGQILSEFKPYEASQPLLEIAKGKKVDDLERRRIALVTLGQIGGASIVQELLNFKRSPELDEALCYALGLTRRVEALPFLLKILKDGFAVKFASVSVETQRAIALRTRGYALIAIALINSPKAFLPLVVDVQREYLAGEYADSGSSSSSSLLFELGRVALKSWQANKMAAVSTSIMVNPYVGLSELEALPAITRRMWMLQQRVSILTRMALSLGKDGLIACYPNAKSPLQRLMVSLPLLNIDPFDTRWLESLVQGAQSRSNEERILSFDGFVKCLKASGSKVAKDWVLRGLEDKDNKVKMATACSVLFNNEETFKPHVFALTTHPSAEYRVGLIQAIMYLAMSGDADAEAILIKLSQHDSDKNVREFASDFLKELPQARQAYLHEYGISSTLESEEAKSESLTPEHSSWASTSSSEISVENESDFDSGLMDESHVGTIEAMDYDIDRDHDATIEEDGADLSPDPMEKFSDNVNVFVKKYYPLVVAWVVKTGKQLENFIRKNWPKLRSRMLETWQSIKTYVIQNWPGFKQKIKDTYQDLETKLENRFPSFRDRLPISLRNRMLVILAMVILLLILLILGGISLIGNHNQGG